MNFYNFDICGMKFQCSLYNLNLYNPNLLKKSKGQIDQWRVMDFLDILMDFLNAYSRNLHLPVNVSTIAFQAISTPSITKCMT